MVSKTLNKDGIARRISASIGVPHAFALRFIDNLVEEVALNIRTNGSVTVSNFGTFSSRIRKKRLGRNPKTLEPVEIMPMICVSYKASSVVRKLVNDGSSIEILEEVELV